MWSVQFIKFFGCRKNKRGSTETYTHVQRGSSFSFVSVIVKNTTLSYFYSSSGCFGNNKTQESGSRFKGCHHQLTLQSVTHKSCLRVERCFVFSLTHTVLSSHHSSCHLNYNRTINRSGATHVRTVFCVYMGLSVCNRYWDGYFGCVTALFVS